MPTYRNDTPRSIRVKSSDGSDVTLGPGESLASIYINRAAGLTKTAETPYYNHCLASESVTLSEEAATVTVVAGAEWFIVIDITGAVTVYRESTSNTPAVMTSYTNILPVRVFRAGDTCTVLKLIGSGTCRVEQYDSGWDEKS